ncbi:pyrophosphate--fructose 6-phosphate 1-phosphotransferase subunit alpha-like [Malania oleifera]|uniref:pyrophosphate--fructose 6-phosphate 1-phosphotransferase subunit alpha-like n=1 Tax=Malania oleifera TaxID=397392 RepID=UPI0025AE6EC7|nr:pyrophosphate--fructose 6-phosphate 1-phosphotransferase subunit alpha-like [Malania oleifera]XP_057980327.1 pyrophosphate--fructose 6-phosphate 1-phosphotransferase subunit alpha-like [Malania oleifera]
MLNQDAEKCLMDDLCKYPGLSQSEGPFSVEKVTSSLADEEDYIYKLNELHAYLDKVKGIVRPGCSQQVLDAALSSLSLLFNTLALVSSNPKFHSSL